MKRKYFDIRKADLGNGQGTCERYAHWSLLDAFVKASCHTLGIDVTSDLLSCIIRRDVGEYIARGKFWLDHDRMYDPTTDLNWIRACRQAWCLLKKYPFNRDEYDVDRKAVAMEKLLRAETICAQTNARLGSTPRGELPPFIWRARGIIADVLGELNAPLIMGIISGRGRHGKGSTCSNHGGRVTAYYKFADFPYTVTKSAANYALAAISASPRWMDILRDSGRQIDVPTGMWPHGNMSRAQSEMMLFSDCVDYAEDDVISFVPKDATTDRGIAFGASLNLFLQLGVNDFLTEKLANVGVDLKDQTRNQRFAYLGSRYWARDGVPSQDQFSTIDLASASDTIATGVVKLLLPSDWFAFLSDLRHESGMVGDTHVVYEKFSAMGNGYTFPLESLIFWAVSKAAQEVAGISVNRDDISVFGDDIIVRYRGAAHAIEALTYLGFEVNTEKSFLSGPFKESCGCDYFLGNDVRPIHLTREVKYDADLYYLANRICRLVLDRGPLCGLNALYNTAVRLVPRDRRRFGSMANTSDECLAVPLSSLNQSGLRPYLTDEEQQHLTRVLRTDKLETHSCRGLNCTPVEVHIQTTARPYKGRVSPRIAVWLHSRLRANGCVSNSTKPIWQQLWDLDYLWLRHEDLLHLEAEASGKITRRGCLDRSWVVNPVPSWDGGYSRRSLTQHPVLFMDGPL